MVFRAAAAASAMSAGMSVISNSAPSDSSFQTIALLATRSTTPFGSRILKPDRQRATPTASRPEAIDDHLDAHVEVGAGAVHLVDEAHARHPIAIGLAPNGLGLRLNTGNAVENGNRAVEHAQRALDLDGEVDVAGRIDDVDPVIAPEGQVVAADVIVMPRSCSCSIQSIVAAPSWTSPIL